MKTLRDLASPVAAFVREMCVVGPDQEIERDTLYAAYRTWAEEGGYPKSPKNVFGRDLKAAVPAISDVRPRVGGGSGTADMSASIWSRSRTRTPTHRRRGSGDPRRALTT